jgi:undecaprenyl-diphosphatase
MEMLKALLLGIVEGITEWLPISSTGHMILADEFIRLNVSPAFREMFFVVIQLGAIFAVILLYFDRLNPLAPGKTPAVRKGILVLWLKVLTACVPAAIIGLLFNDFLDAVFYNYQTVSLTLIIYGVLFIILENKNKDKEFPLTDLDALTYKTAVFIGLFQLLALIPGTSRSGATILGAMLIGASRPVAAEFSFFLAIPVMLGASLVKLLKFGFSFTGTELVILSVGTVSAFIVSIIAIKFLIGFIQKHDFKAFGYYRIVLGLVVLAYFLI